MSENAIVKLEKLTLEASEIQKMESQFQKVFKIAVVAKQLDAVLTNDIVKNYIVPIAGTRIGFRTDKDTEGGYPVNVVRNICKEAFLLGLPIGGNCINIIGGNLYATKEGFNFLLSELNIGHMIDVSNIEIVKEPYYDTEKRKGVQGRATASVEMSFYKSKKKQSIKKQFSCKINKGMDEDGIEGKITRKALKWLYEYITKVNIPLAEDDNSGDNDNLEIKQEKQEKQEIIEEGTLL